MNDPIKDLRAEMKRRGIDACIIFTSDPHLSEYTSEYFCFRKYLSPFSGSAGTLVITMEESGLWTDGRYYIQAEKELAGTETVLFKASEKDTLTVSGYLTLKLKSKSTVSADGRLCSKMYADRLAKDLGKSGINLVFDIDFSYIWKNRPALPGNKVFLLEEKYSGESASHKLERVRKKMSSHFVTHYAVSKTDCVMWLLNIRGNDVPNTPVALSYMLISLKEAFLYIEKDKISNEVFDYIKKSGVTLKEYTEIYSDITLLDNSCMLGADFSETNYLLIGNASCAIKNIADIISGLKCIKNETEIRNLKLAYIKENAALVKSFYEIYCLCGKINECNVSDIIEKHRKKDSDYLYPSFETIAAYGENAAMMHYSPEKGNCAYIKNSGMLLIDTGAQSKLGTTDTTRTLILGDIPYDARENYTLVLKGHIAALTSVFPEGTQGSLIDYAARNPLWQKMLDYRCSTGHGVGYFLCVHEDPPRLSPSKASLLKEGMTVTDEPGVYMEGQYGVRIENHLHIIKRGASEYGKFLCFEPLGFCPIGTYGLITELLSEDEKKWLNDYNQTTCRLLKDRLTAEEYSWLTDYTKAI